MNLKKSKQRFHHQATALAIILGISLTFLFATSYIEFLTPTGFIVTENDKCVDLTKQSTWKGLVKFESQSISSSDDQMDPEMKKIRIPTYYISGDVTLCPKEYKIGLLKINAQNTKLNCNNAVLLPVLEDIDKYYDYGIHVKDESSTANFQKPVNNPEIKNCIIPEGNIILESVNLGKVIGNKVQFLQLYNTRNTVVENNMIVDGKVYLIESQRITFNNNQIQRTKYEERYIDLLDTFLVLNTKITNNVIKVPEIKPDSVRSSYRGIILSAARETIVENNKFEGYFGDALSISKASADNEIKNNMLMTKSRTGISIGYLESSGDKKFSKPPENTIMGNTFCHGEAYDIAGFGDIVKGLTIQDNTCDKSNVDGGCSEKCI
ncbi:hypothetical protein HYY69_08385 [Candidatus Woesearchaeota archaeon]|nr:hypothetical protein [Candidatus Woesearchaeota archaeon]